MRWCGSIAWVAGALPNLQAILVLGAGVDSVLADSGCRLMCCDTAGGRRMPGPMAEYALYAVLHFQRRMADYYAQQRTAIWQLAKNILRGIGRSA